MAPIPVQHFSGRDGARLAYRELGDGRPLVLLHGFFSTGFVNWFRYGHAELLAQRGFRVLAPDLRAHGDSAKPHEPAAYPDDVLTDDALAFVEQLGLDDYDLGGYSLGGRTVVRMIARGATPRRAVVAGVGLSDVTHATARRDYFRHVLTNLGSFEHGTAEWLAEAFLRTTGGDAEAMLLLLDSWTDTPREVVELIETPTLVVMGDGDDRDAPELADALADASYRVIPGTHMSAVTKPPLGQAIAEFLSQT